MSKCRIVRFANIRSDSFAGSIIVASVDCKFPSPYLVFNVFSHRVVCANCSNNSWYVPGYADKKVRMCDNCYKGWMAYKVSAHNINKTSVFSSYFGNNELRSQ